MKFVLICAQQWDYNDDVLLVLKNKPEWQRGRWNLPGGKVEDNECPEDAAIRELKEETGYEPTIPVRMMGLLVDGECEIFCFNAVVPARIDPNPYEGESQEVTWEPWYQARKDSRLIPNLTLIIPLIRSGVQGWTIRDQYRSSLDKSSHGIYVELSCGIKTDHPEV